MRHQPHPLATSPRYAGFTLIELSIVLVIIGLIIGGILGGQALIRSAELKKVVTDFSKYRAAVNEFKNQYAEFPGDLAYATDYWGTAANCPGLFSQPSTDRTTCNGNGNTKIDYTGVATAHEQFRAWQHLTAAGLITGQYDGVPANGSSVRTYDRSNTPQGTISNSYFAIASYDYRPSTDPFWWEGNYDNQLLFAGYSSDGYGENPVLSPAELWAIDSKIDDGKPASGLLRTFRKNYASNCTTTNVESTTEYNLSYSDIACAAIYLGLQESR